MKNSSLIVTALVSTALFAAAATANADNMSYNVTTYSYPDNLNPGYTATVSGTVTITNTAGSVFQTYTAGSPALADVFMTATLTESTTAPGVSPVTLTGSGNLGTEALPEWNYLASGSLDVTPAGVFLSNDGYLSIEYESNIPFTPYIEGQIDPHDNGGSIALSASLGANGGAATMQINSQNLDAVYGDGAWQIAVVPEPSTMILFALGGLALLACGRRR